MQLLNMAIYASLAGFMGYVVGMGFRWGRLQRELEN